eukprot:TRINITY_DN1624_c0_g1_i2.p1 TRINITY_DN1624_c0_g1~~TRINITY_DN1624_c0_g1_i2.p1  ORF type:complete len:612 (+),score=125.17 TRINITY_DN1624_c0_g1_i2:47-1837(+)
MTGRPFSGKAKKAQLQAKRAQKAEKKDLVMQRLEEETRRAMGELGLGDDIKAVEEADREGLSTRKGVSYKNDKRSVFRKEAREEVDKRRELAQIPYEERVFDKGVQFEGWWPGCRVPQSVEIPMRPPWEATDTEAQITKREEKYFKKYIESIDASHGKALNMFERNLEVWRQLWRVCEMSDVLAVVIDARHPLFHLPSSLMRYIKDVLNKPVFVIMNKIDLVPGSVVASWEKYLQACYPDLIVVRFTCHPNLETVTLEINSTQFRKRRKRAAKQKVNYNENPEEREEEDTYDDGKSSVTTNTSGDEEVHVEAFKGEKKFEEEAKRDVTPHQERIEVHKMLSKIIETARELGVAANGSGSTSVLGLVGHPNVGKSSLVNTLKGEKVVSTSSTAGHTKHLQHIRLTQDVMLCDCPGLTFPSVGLPLCIQVLMGSFALAQNREPYSAVHYLGQRLPLERIYHMQRPRSADPEDGWSGWALCESYAEKNGMFLNRGRGIPDCYRAGQAIIKEAVNGILVLYFLPPPIDTKPLPPKPTHIAITDEKEDTSSSDDGGLVSGDESDTSDDAVMTGNTFDRLGSKKKPFGKQSGGKRGGGRKRR